MDRTIPPKLSLATLGKLARALANDVIKGLAVIPNPNLDTVPTCQPCLGCFSATLENFLKTVGSISQERKQTGMSTLRSNYADVLDACASFASSIWTEEDISRLEGGKYQQHDIQVSGNEYTSLEEIGGRKRIPLHNIILQVFRILDAVALDLRFSATNAINLEKKGGKHSKWPPSPSKFIPQGASAAVIAFVKWAKVAENVRPLNTLFQLTCYCPSLMAAMDEERALLPLIEDLFCRFVKTIQEVSPGNMNPTHSAFIENQLLIFVDIFKSVWLQDRLYATDEIFVGDNIETLTSMYNATYSLAPLLGLFAFSDRSQEHIICALATIHEAICNWSGSTLPPLPLHPPLTTYILKYKDQHINLGITDAMAGTMLLQNQRKCSDVSCDQTGEETRSNLKICGACKVIRYCSKECQLSDWEEHKQVCKSMKTVQVLATDRLESMVSMSQAGACKLELHAFNEKLRRLSGLTEEEIDRVRKYTSQRVLFMRHIRERPNSTTVEALDAVSARFGAPYVYMPRGIL